MATTQYESLPEISGEAPGPSARLDRGRGPEAFALGEIRAAHGEEYCEGAPQLDMWRPDR